MPRDPAATRDSLLDAAERLFIERGYAATSVDDICTAAEVTKGAFFHHYPSKQELAVAAAIRFQQVRAELMRAAPFQSDPDPLQRVLGFIDFLSNSIRNERVLRGCLIGTLTQELALCDERLRETCGEGLKRMVRAVLEDLAAAKKSHPTGRRWSPETLANHIVSVLQGSLLISKATGSPDVVVQSLGHVRKYIELLFEDP